MNAGSFRSSRRRPPQLVTWEVSSDEASGGPATELRFDRGGGYFILKRQ